MAPDPRCFADPPVLGGSVRREHKEGIFSNLLTRERRTSDGGTGPVTSKPEPKGAWPLIIAGTARGASPPKDPA